MSPQAKRGRGRPPHEPDNQSRQLVEVAAAHGVPQTEIARLLGINEKTLRLYYRPELGRGTALAEALSPFQDMPSLPRARTFYRRAVMVYRRIRDDGLHPADTA